MSMFLFFQTKLLTHRQNDYRTLPPTLRGEGIYIWMHSPFALVHVDSVVLTDEPNVLIAINEKVMSLMTLLHVFCTKIDWND